LTDHTPLITDVLKREGWDKYTNHAEDRGGPTKWGITQRAWSGYIGRDATADDIAVITELQARTFYLHEYIIKPHFDLIENAFVQELVIDCGVNHGTRAAAKWLQRAAGAKADGAVGPNTLFAVNTASPYILALRILASRVKLYGRLVTRDHRQAKFAAGWNARAASFLTALAREMGEA